MSAQSPFCVDDAASDAGHVADLLAIASELVNEMEFFLPDGRRHVRLDQLNSLLFVAEDLARKLVETVDALPRVRVQA